MESHFIFFIVYLTGTAAENYIQSYFEIIPDVKVANAELSFEDISLAECGRKCLENADCALAGYNEDSRVCQISSHTQTISDPDFVIVNPTEACGIPLTPAHGQMEVIDPGKIVRFSCDTGYTLVGSRTHHCMKSSWNETVPFCDPADCGVPSLPANGAQFIFIGTSLNDMATLVCVSGYVPAIETVTCQADGSWENTYCDVLDCGVPSLPANGDSFNYTGTSLNNVASLVCTSGYVPTIDSVTCQADGTWGNTYCVIDCGIPSLPANGDRFNYVGTFFNEKATLVCMSGYGPAKETVTCHADGSWENTSCVLDCGTYLDMNYTNINAMYPDGSLEGSTAIVTCARGYRSDTGYTSWNFACDAADQAWKSSIVPDCIWELMFRGTAGNGYNVTNAFLFGDAADGVTSNEGCMDVYNSSCTLNYRNTQMDLWASLSILEVSYDLYNSTDNVLSVQFDGVGSTINSWFSTSTVLQHPWTIPILGDTWWDLNGPTDITVGRSFRMTAGYDQNAVACADHYYTVVFFPPGWTCTYDDFASYPTFTYSKASGGAVYSTEPFQTAQTMGIWAKYS